MPAVFSIYNRPRGYDQTQKRFTLSGTMLLTGTYTNGTGIAPTFATNSLDQAGNPYTLPPTYTGTNGPGQGMPIRLSIATTAGYNFVLTNGSIRIYSAGTELATGTVPTGISAAGIDAQAEFLRG